jgi:hypothetical protein
MRIMLKFLYSCEVYSDCEYETLLVSVESSII